MLKDNFYGYGLISKVLNILIVILIILIYISAFLNEFTIHTFWYRNFLGFLFILFFVLLFKGFWWCINQKPMSWALTRIGAFMLNLNLCLIYFTLLGITISSFWEFIFDSYCQYLININTKVSYMIFGIKLIPFSVIQLICYLLENYMHFNIMLLRVLLGKICAILFVGALPSLILLYIIQILINRKLYKKHPPELLS